MFYLSYITIRIRIQFNSINGKNIKQKTVFGYSLIELMSKIFNKKTVKSNQQILLHFLNINQCKL